MNGDEPQRNSKELPGFEKAQLGDERHRKSEAQSR